MLCLVTYSCVMSLALETTVQLTWHTFHDRGHCPALFLCLGGRSHRRHTVVRLCMYVCVCPSVGKISRRSLNTKRWNKQHRQISTLPRIWIVDFLFCYSVRELWHDLLTLIAVAGDLDFFEDKNVYSWLPLVLYSRAVLQDSAVGPKKMRKVETS